MKSANNFNKNNFKNELEETKHNFLTSFQTLLYNKVQNAAKYRLRGGGILQSQMFPNVPMCLQTNSPVMYMSSMPNLQQQTPVVVCSPVTNSCGAPTLIVTLPNASPAPAPPQSVATTPQRVPPVQVPKPVPKIRPQTAPNPSVRQKLSFADAPPSLPKPVESKKPTGFSHLDGKLYIKEGQIVSWPKDIVPATPIRSPRDYTPQPGESWMRWTDEVQTPKSPVRAKQASPAVHELTVEPARGDGDETPERQFLGVPAESSKFASLGCSSLSDLNSSPEEIAQNVLNMTGSQENEGLAVKEAKEKANLAKLVEALQQRRQREIMEMVKDALEGRLPVGMKDNTARF